MAPTQTLETDGRVPPQAVEVEKAVLGSMMIEQEAAATAVQMISPDDFYKPAHRNICTVMFALYDEDAPLDLITIEEKLRDNQWLENIGGAGYLTELTRAVSSAANIDYHAQILREKSDLRKIILSCTGVIKEAYDPSADVYDVLENLGKTVDRLTLGDKRNEGITVAEQLPDTLDRIDAARRNPNNITGIAAGFDIDSYTAGFQEGDLIIIGSRPSMGKTAALISMSRNMITSKNPDFRTGVAAFSLEMSRHQYVQRLLSQEGRLNNENLRAGKIREHEFKDLCTVIAPKIHDQGQTAPMIIDDTPGLSLRVLRSKIRSYLRKHPEIGIVMIDYLQLMNISAEQGGTRDIQIGQVTQGLKNLAKELAIPIVLFSQLSRKVEQRTDKRPQLSDLRESGNIEQDADIVVFLYRPEYYDIEVDKHGNPVGETYGEWIIAKQREGPVGDIPMYFKKEYAMWGNAASSWAQDTFDSPNGQEPTQQTLGDDEEKPF